MSISLFEAQTNGNCEIEIDIYCFKREENNRVILLGKKESEARNMKEY